MARVYNMSGGGGSSKRTARIIIGTSTAGWTLNDCDYLCDGVNDQLEIRNAINALPDGGGEIVILDGEYSLTSSIGLQDGTKLIGNGAGTVFLKKTNSDLITVRANCLISHIFLNGNKSEFSSGSAIYFYNSQNSIIQDIYIDSANIGLGFAIGTEAIISKNFIKNCNTGIYFSGNSSKNLIDGNRLKDNGIGISVFTTSNLVANNYIFRGTGTPSDYTSSQYTIKCSGRNNLFANNYILGKNYSDTGTGNTWANNKFE